MKNLVWFRNDLRLHDNPSLLSAEKNGFHTLFVYVLDKAQKHPHELGFPKQGVFRERFLLESLLDLHQSLEKIGAVLLVLEGNPIEWLNIITEKEQITHVFYQTEIAWEEKQQEKKLLSMWKEKGVKVKRHFNSVLYDINKAPFELDRTPDVFTVFRKKMEASLEIEKPLPEPKQVHQAEIAHYSEAIPIQEIQKRLSTLVNQLEKNVFNSTFSSKIY
jgi:deoxyribodipyrimidine photo-lyase